MPIKTTDPAIMELSIRMETILGIINKLEETNEGTLRTRGVKEKITIMEMNIEANKLAWQNVNSSFSALREELSKSLDKMTEEIRMSINSRFSELEINISTVKKEGEAHKTVLGKLQPWINIIAWVASSAGSILLGLLLSGKLSITMGP